MLPSQSGWLTLGEAPKTRTRAMKRAHTEKQIEDSKHTHETEKNTEQQSEHRKRIHAIEQTHHWTTEQTQKTHSHVKVFSVDHPHRSMWFSLLFAPPFSDAFSVAALSFRVLFDCQCICCVPTNPSLYSDIMSHECFFSVHPHRSM